MNLVKQTSIEHLHDATNGAGGGDSQAEHMQTLFICLQ